MKHQRADDNTWKVVFDATSESISRTRRTLVVLIGLMCISFFHLYMWYGSWDLARVAGRRALLQEISLRHGKETYLFGSRANDERRIKEINQEILAIERKRTEAQFKPPLLGLEVGVNDFTVAAQMVTVATLLWLIFNQKRLNYCLRKLDSMGGWNIPKYLIELNFGLIGSHADFFMKIVGRLIPLAPPIVSALFIASDLYDLSTIQASEWQRVAFENTEYRTRVFVRLGSDTLLSLSVVVLGFWSLAEWLRTEEELTKFSKQQDAIGSLAGPGYESEEGDSQENDRPPGRTG